MTDVNVRGVEAPIWKDMRVYALQNNWTMAQLIHHMWWKFIEVAPPPDPEPLDNH